VAEARQWLSLFDGLGSAHAAPLLPHLSLRAADAAALLDVCPRAAASLRRILAETSGEETLDQVNGVLAAAYAEMEVGFGARLARSVFALASDGFPDDGAVRLMERWERPLRRLLDDFAASGLPDARRDVVVAMVGHHLAELDALRGATHLRADAEHVAWLRTLVEWRRFASLGRALALVLSVTERERLAAFLRGDGGDGAGVAPQASTA
jgi:hypothetical protein